MISITVTTNYQGFWQVLENSWSGARDVLNRVYEVGREEEAMQHIAEFCGMVQDSTGAPPEDVQVNDFIWFELADLMDLYHENADGDDVETEEEEEGMIYNSLEGKRFALRQDPYIDGPAGTRGYYTALATCPDDIPDENGEVPLYQVYWDIRDDWDGDDESCACEWDEIVSWDNVGTI